MAKRHFILDTIKKVYQKYVYALLNPAMENLSVLQGKYGDEGDQCFLNIEIQGFPIKTEAGDRNDSKTLQPKISEKGLRYDFNRSFARFVVMHQMS